MCPFPITPAYFHNFVLEICVVLLSALFWYCEREACSPGWPHLGLFALLLHLPVLGLQACTTTPSLFHAGDSIQGWTHARQRLCQQSYISGPVFRSVFCHCVWREVGFGFVFLGRACGPSSTYRLLGSLCSRGVASLLYTQVPHVYGWIDGNAAVSLSSWSNPVQCVIAKSHCFFNPDVPAFGAE